MRHIKKEAQSINVLVAITALSWVVVFAAGALKFHHVF